MTILIGILEQGFIYAFLALGLYVSYGILGFPDLTTEGSFPLGASVCCLSIMAGLSPALALFLAMAAGAAAGVITGILHVKLGIKDLLSGVIVMTGLYTVNLLLAGKANVPIFTKESIFKNSMTEGLQGKAIYPWMTVIISFAVLLAVKLLLDAFLKTKAGYLLKATGDNPSLVMTLAKDPGKIKIAGLAIGNCLIALSGAILTQQQRFFEISMGTGSLVVGLASLIMGLKLFERLRFVKKTTAVIAGSLLYKSIMALAIAIGIDPVGMKLISAILLLIVLIFASTANKRTHKDASDREDRSNA